MSGTLVGTVSFLVNTALTFLLVPLLLGRWGAETYGAWLALQSLYTLLISLDSGHQSYVGNELAKWYFADSRLLRTTLASGIWMALLVGVVELLTVSVLYSTQTVPAMLGLSRSTVRNDHLDVALFISTVIWVLCGSVGGLLVRLLPPAGKFVRYVVWGIVARLAQTIALACAAFAGLRILGATVVAAMVTGAYTLALFRDLDRQFESLRPMYAGGSVLLGVRNFTRSLLLTVSTTIVQIQQSGINLLITTSLGVGALPLFTTARTAASTFTQATTVLCGPLAPEMVRFHVLHEHEKLHGTFTAHWLIGGGVMQVGLMALLPVLAPLYALWTRSALVFDFVVFALLAFAIVIRAFGSPLQTYLASVNHLRAVSAVSTVQTAAALGTAYLGLHRFGLRGAALGILVGEVIGSLILPLYFVLRELPAPWRSRLLWDAGLAIAPMFATGYALWAYARHLPLSAIYSSVVVLIPLLWLQWHRLAPAVRARIAGLARRLVHARAP